MNTKTIRWYNRAVWINAVVAVIWMGLGLRDYFAPHLFRFDGRVAPDGTVLLDFALAAIFLMVAVTFHLGKPKALQNNT